MNARWLAFVAVGLIAGCSGSSSGTDSGSSGTSSGTNAGTNSSTGTSGAGSTSGSGGSTGSCTQIPGSSGSGGTSGGGTCSVDDNGSQCSALPIPGCPVHEVQVAQDVPAAVGGTPVSGTYVATSIIDYLGTAGTPSETGSYRQQVLVFTGSSVEMHELDFQSGGPDCGSSQTGTVTFSGNQVTLTPTCPTGSNNGGSVAYSATSTTFTIFDPPDGSNRTFTRVTTLTKQ